MPRLSALLPFVLALSLTACDGGDPDGPGAGCDDGSMTATVDGDAFSAACVVITLESGVLAVAGTVDITGGATQRQINITLPNATEGTHSIGPGHMIVATYAEVDPANPSAAQVYTANPVIGSGEFVVDEFSSTSARGSFRFTAYTSGTTPITVTSGAFDIAK